MNIYKITNIITGHIYIGQTKKSIKRRFAVHRCNSRAGVDTHLYRAMRKYGVEKFSADLLESQVPEAKLNQAERDWIALLKPQYNMTPGGEDNTIMTQKHADAMKKYHSNRSKETYATYGMKGKKQPLSAKVTLQYKGQKPCKVKGKWFFSTSQARDYYKISRTEYYRWKSKGYVSYS